MNSMFFYASSFSQDISNWNIENLQNADKMLEHTKLSTANYDSLLNGWAVQSVKSGVKFGTSAKYSNTGQPGRDTLTGAPNNWSITDGGMSRRVAKR